MLGSDTLEPHGGADGRPNERDYYSQRRPGDRVRRARRRRMRELYVDVDRRASWRSSGAGRGSPAGGAGLGFLSW